MRSKVRTEEEEVQEMESDDGEEEKESDEDERASWIRRATSTRVAGWPHGGTRVHHFANLVSNASSYFQNKTILFDIQ